MYLSKTKLATALVAVMTLGATAAMAANPFTDIPEGAFYEDPVDWLYDNELTTGSPSGSNTFKPLDNVTRGEYATFNYRYDQNVVQPALEDIRDDIDEMDNELDAMPMMLFARVDNDGTLVQGSSGVTSVKDGGTGGYTVDFGSVDVSGCYWQATPTMDWAPFTPDNFLILRQSGNFGGTDPTAIEVEVADETGASEDRSFDLIVFCEPS